MLRGRQYFNNIHHIVCANCAVLDPILAVVQVMVLEDPTKLLSLLLTPCVSPGKVRRILPPYHTSLFSSADPESTA